MENASKALIMAGGMLISVIIITIGVYIFNSIGGNSKEIQKQMDSRVLAEFNNTFQKYDKSKECTIHDIVSLASFAKKNNQDFEQTSDYQVNVYIDNVSGYKGKDLTTLTEDDYITLLKKYSIKYVDDIKTGNQTAQQQYFECINIDYKQIDADTKRVVSITFKMID